MRYFVDDDDHEYSLDFEVGPHFTQWEWAAEECAKSFHDTEDGWEFEWPLDITLENGMVFCVEAEVEVDVCFSASPYAVTLEGGERLEHAHSSDRCAGSHCTIHNRSDHHMRDWPQHWRDDRGIVERICPHGIGHPDPDEICKDRTHGCDGCCRKEDNG